jgi:hypothetical protein
LIAGLPGLRVVNPVNRRQPVSGRSGWGQGAIGLPAPSRLLEGPGGALGQLGSGGCEDVLGFSAGEFVAFTEGFGKAVDGVEVGADQVLGAVAEWAQVAAGFAPAGVVVAELEQAEGLGCVEAVSGSGRVAGGRPAQAGL